jgi:ATP-dependent DNA helicase RecG
MATDPAKLLENIRKPVEMARKTSRLQIVKQNIKRIRQWIMELAPQLPEESRHFWARLVQAIDREKPLAEIYGMLEKVLGEDGLPLEETTRTTKEVKTSRRAVPAKYHLDTPLQYLKGVGPRKAKILERVGLKQLEDLLYYFPRDYEDRRRTWRIEELTAGCSATIMVRVLQTELARLPGRRSLLTVAATDGSGTVLLKWWNQPYLEERLAQGAMLLVSGRVNKFQGRLEINSPEYELAEHFDGINYDRIVPIYPLTEGLTQKTLRRLTYLAMESSESLPEILPNEVLISERFPPIHQAIRQLHFPDELTDTELARRRLAYQELFLLQVGLTLRRRRLRRELGVSLDFSGGLRDRLLASLPFQPTGAQLRVLGEIEEDLRGPYPMNRLIQGDVGSGKTLTALLAILDTVESGAQAVLMAPTEILARQHYANIGNMLAPLGIAPVLLVGGQEPGERTRALSQLASGEAALAVGTHALFSEKIAFHKLGLVVIDEQHRFGVYQRAALLAKGRGPNLLVMTATPIPRTLAMALYGDLDLSIIDQMPPGRGTITTKVFEFDNHQQALDLVREQVSAGRQAFFVYPLVEQSQKLDVRAATQMYRHLANGPLSGFRLGLVHGQMPRKEQDNVMSSFRQGEIDILVSTTVTEVGIDVVNATVMVVENAERFGLSQLHQLRGRIGRGQADSYCLLVLAEDAPEISRARVEVLAATTDGFRIAEEDLRLRGPGEYLGSRQSGIPDFALSVLLSYPDLIIKAKEQAEALVLADPNLRQEQHQNLKRRLLSVYADRLDLALSG